MAQKEEIRMKRSDLSPAALAEYVRLQTHAGGKVHRAIEQGLLPPVCTKYRWCFETIKSVSCVDCDNQAQCYDHRDYLEPLTVEPVCERCNYRRGFAMNTFTDHPEYWSGLGKGAR